MSQTKPVAPADGQSSAEAPPTALATASAFAAPETSSQTSLARRTAGNVRVIRTGGGLGESVTRDYETRFFANSVGMREQRVDVSFAAHTEQVHVERRNLIPVCLSAQQLFVRRRRPVWITVVDTVGCGHRMYPVGIDRHMIEKRLTCLHFVPLGIAGRQEPFVAPVQIDLRPSRCRRELHATSREVRCRFHRQSARWTQTREPSGHRRWS